METGDVIIQEPISTKTSVEEASAGVVLLDQLSMEIADKVKMSSVLDDKITSSSIILGKADVTEVVNDSGDKETEKSEREKGEAKKTILVKEKASETEKEEQGSIFVHEPENAEDGKIILSDVTLEKEKDDSITQKPEEVIFEKSMTKEDQTETKHAAEQEKEMNNIPEVLVDKSPVKIDEDETEKSLVSPHEKILIKRSDEENVTKDETGEEKDSRSVETPVNETDVVHNAMVPVEEISRNIVKEDDREGVKEEPVEATKYIDDTEKISHKVTGDREKEEDITQKVEEVQESPLVIETPAVQGENIESNVSKDTDEHEHVLVREMAQSETLATEAEAVNTPTVQVVEDHTETKHSAEQEEEIGKISKVMSDTAPVISEDDATEKSLNSACEDILTKTDEVKEEEESRTGETSVNGSEAEHTATNPVEEVSTNTVKVTVPEKDTPTFGESLGDVETTTRVLEAEKYAEPKLDAKEKDEGETTVQESESLKENAEKTSHEVDVEREKEEDVTPNTEEQVRESPREIETPTIQGEDIESKASLDHEEEVVESSRETKEHEHGETLVETVDISKTLETKEDTETNPDLKEDKGEETVLSSNGVKSSNVEAEEFGEQTEPCSSEIKEESHRREEFVEVKSKETVQDEISEDNLVDGSSKETEKYEDKDPETALDSNTESREKCEEAPLDLTLKVDKEEVKDENIKKDEVDGTQTVEKQIGLDSNEPEGEQTDENRSDETGESPVEKLAALPDVESLSQVSESVDEKIEEKSEEVTPQQGSYGIETDSVQKSCELGEKVGEERSVIDLTPLQEEPRLPNEQVKETKLQEEEMEKHEQTNVEVKSGEVPSAELEGETVIAAEKTENVKADEEEQAPDKIHKNLVTVETVDSSLPPSSEEQEHDPVSENVKDQEVKEDEPPVQITREDDATESHERKDEFSKTGETGPSLNADEEITVRDMPQDETSVDACTIQEGAISETPETNITESKTVPGPIGLKEESQEIKEDSEPSLHLKEDKEQEDPKTIKTDISSDEVKSCDVQAEEFDEHCHLPEIKDDGHGREETVEAKPKEIVQDESTQEKDENPLDGESSETMQKISSSQEEDSYKSETKEEPCLPNEQETKLQKEQIEKHEPKHEEVSSDQKSPREEKFDEISKVSSASLSEEREGETIVEAEKIEDIKTNEAEQEADKIQKSLEAVEIAEPHSSLPSSSEKQEHGTVSEAEVKEDKKVKEAEPTSIKSPEKIVEEKKADEDMMMPGLDGSGTSKTSESVCIKQDEFDNLSETTKATEASNNQNETPSSELISEQNDQTSKLAEETHEVSRESSSEVPVSMLAAKEDYQEGDVTEIKETEPERPVSTETEETTEETKPKVSVDDTRNDTFTAEVKRGDEAVKEIETTGALDSSGTLKTPGEEEFRNPEAPKLEESKEDKSQDILPVETSQADRTLASELVSDQTLKMAEEEEKEAHKLQVADDQILPVETLQEDQNPSFVSELENQIPKQAEEIYEEETKVANKLQFPVETSQVEQTESLVLERDDQTSKLAHLQASFSEASASKLASGEEELVNLEEGGDTQEERHVSVETEERVGETKPEANDQVKTPTKLTKEEDENTKITNGQSISNSPEDVCLRQEELKDTETLHHGATTEDQSPLLNDNQDYPTGEAEQEDESSSTLPVVEILKGLHTTLEAEGEIIDSASSKDNIREPTEKVQKSSDAEVVSNEKDSAAEIIEAKRLQQDESGKIQEEKSLPKEELKLQEEDKEEVQVEDSISREFEVSVKEKLQEEETSQEIAEKQEEYEAQEDTNASKQERISLQEEHPRDSEISDQVMESDLPADLLLTVKKTVEEEKQIVDVNDDVKEEKKSTQVQDEKLGRLSASRDTGESNSSGMKTDQEDASELGVLPDFQVEKMEEPKSELIQPQQSPSQLEESSFEGSKAQEHSKEDTSDALIKNENVQVEDQPMNFEGPVEDKETSEQEQESNDLTHVQEDIGTNYKLGSDGHDSVVEQKEETNLTEEKKEVEYVKIEQENAMKNGVSIEEECFNSMKNTDDVTEKTKPEIREIENLSSVKDIQNISKEIEEPQQETLKIAQELQKKDGESENSKDLFSEVKDSEPTMQELAKKSLSGENMISEPTEKVQNPNSAEEEKEEVKLEDSTSREFEVSVKEKSQEEDTRESTVEEKEHKAREDGNASTEEVVCLKAEHPRDLEILDQVMEPELPADLPHTEKKTEIDETFEEEEQIVDSKEEKKSAEVQDDKLEGVNVTKDTEETFSSEVKKDQDIASKLGVGQGFTLLQVEKEEEPQSVKEKLQEEETREVAEKQEEVKTQEDANASTVEVISLQEKQPRDFEISQKVGDNSVQVLESEAPADLPRTEMKTQIDETVEKEDQILSIKEVKKSEDVQDEKIEGVFLTKDTEETFSSEVKKDQENASELGVGHDFTLPQVEKEEEPHSVLVNDEEKQTKDLVGVTKNAEQESKEEHVETQAIADDTKKNDRDFQIKEADADKSLTKEALDDQIQVPSLAAPGDQDLSVKQQSEHIQLQQSPNQVEETSFKASDALIKNENTSNKTEKNKASEKIDHDASKETEETKPDISEIENLSSVSDKSMITEELQRKHGESENTKDTFSQVKDSEPTTKEPARKSLSDLIPTVKGTTNKTEEEERKTEEEDEDGDEHKDDKTSPDSLVMVEAKDTVHIIKTHHKKSHGILSGVGSKVKHSISKVKKALIGKSSHTTKPSSPK